MTTLLIVVCAGWSRDLILCGDSVWQSALNISSVQDPYNTVSYFLEGNGPEVEMYFQVNSASGEISLRSSVLNNKSVVLHVVRATLLCCFSCCQSNYLFICL